MFSLLFCLSVLLVNWSSVSTDSSSPSFCLCALKDLLEDYALFTLTDSPPRYRSQFSDDIGFFIVGPSSQWKPVNNATWMDIASMSKSVRGLYSHISLDGRTPLNDGLLLNGLRSAFLAEILTAYRTLISQVDQFHEHVISSRTQTCLWATRDQSTGNRNDWRQFFR